MSAGAHWPAPAKLNLFLHITGRRDDGYHLLQTVFQFLDYGDRLHFTVRDDGAVQRTSDLAGVAPESDLVVRAARRLQQSTGCALGVEIRVEKILPMGGGLGGGSSDAATTLVALNRLWGLELPQERLAALALELGADVPIFVHGHAAWAEGVGERVTPIDPPTPWYVVLVPNVHVATAELFRASELTRNCPPITISDFLSGAGSNVFEPVVRARHPEVAAALDWLDTYAPARLTGTGGCVFAPFGNEPAAADAFAQRPAGWHGFVAHGTNRSPLLTRLENERPAVQSA